MAFLFGNDNPIHIEVGTGKGQFINGMGKQNPSINYLGMELYDSIIITALDRILEDKKPNVKLIRADATHLLDYFEPGEIDRVYLNFSDPWPKKKHAKRRLTHESFLKRYETVLKKPGKFILRLITKVYLNTRFTVCQRTECFLMT